MRATKPFTFGAMSRRAALTGAALTAMVSLSACGGDKAASAAEGDMGLGLPDGAKVTVVEYASVTCSHSTASGFTAERSGSLDSARLLEPMGLMNVKFAYALGRGTGIAPAWVKLAA